MSSEPAHDPKDAQKAKVTVPKRLEWQVNEAITKAIETAGVRGKSQQIIV